MTKTEQALKYVDEGMKPFAAAKLAQVSPNAVYLALKKRREQLAAGLETCPCCGTLVDKSKIDWNVIK